MPWPSKVTAIGALLLIAVFVLVHRPAGARGRRAGANLADSETEALANRPPARSFASTRSSLERNAGIHKAFGRPDPVELIAALSALVASGSAAAGDERFGRQLQALTEADPDAAALFIAALDRGFVREVAFRIVAHQWAYKDFRGASGWAEALPDPDDRTRALTDITFQLAVVNPELALQCAQAYHLDKTDRVVENLVATWSRHDPAAARAWVENLPAGDTRNLALARVALAIAEKDPRAAADLVGREISPGTDRDDAALSLLHLWSARDPVSAAAWLNTWRDEPLRARARQELLGIFGRDASS